MRRLTCDQCYCDLVLCDWDESCCRVKGCWQKRIWERLKAYEDTGLTPEEVSLIPRINTKRIVKEDKNV